MGLTVHEDSMTAIVPRPSTILSCYETSAVITAVNEAEKKKIDDHLAAKVAN